MGNVITVTKTSLASGDTLTVFTTIEGLFVHIETKNIIERWISLNTQKISPAFNTQAITKNIEFVESSAHVHNAPTTYKINHTTDVLNGRTDWEKLLKQDLAKMSNFFLFKLMLFVFYTSKTASCYKTD